MMKEHKKHTVSAYIFARRFVVPQACTALKIWLKHDIVVARKQSKNLTVHATKYNITLKETSMTI